MVNGFTWQFGESIWIINMAKRLNICDDDFLFLVVSHIDDGSAMVPS